MELVKKESGVWKNNKNTRGGVIMAQWLITCFGTQLPRVGFPAFPNFYPGVRIIDFAEVDQWLWLHESGHWLENVD